MDSLPLPIRGGSARNECLLQPTVVRQSGFFSYVEVFEKGEKPVV